MNTTSHPAVRAAVALPIAVALLFGTAACAQDAGVSEEEIGQIERDYAELEERVGVLEDEVGV